MRCFDAAHLEMRPQAGRSANPPQRNPSAPDWIAGPRRITGSFVHGVDLSRWLMGAEVVSAHVQIVARGEALMTMMVTDAAGSC